MVGLKGRGVERLLYFFYCDQTKTWERWECVHADASWEIIGNTRNQTLKGMPLFIPVCSEKLCDFLAVLYGPD